MAEICARPARSVSASRSASARSAIQTQYPGRSAKNARARASTSWGARDRSRRMAPLWYGLGQVVEVEEKEPAVVLEVRPGGGGGIQPHRRGQVVVPRLEQFVVVHHRQRSLQDRGRDRVRGDGSDRLGRCHRRAGPDPGRRGRRVRRGCARPRRRAGRRLRGGQRGGGGVERGRGARAM